MDLKEMKKAKRQKIGDKTEVKSKKASTVPFLLSLAVDVQAYMTGFLTFTELQQSLKCVSKRFQQFVSQKAHFAADFETLMDLLKHRNQKKGVSPFFNVAGRLTSLLGMTPSDLATPLLFEELLSTKTCLFSRVENLSFNIDVILCKNKSDAGVDALQQYLTRWPTALYHLKQLELVIDHFVLDEEEEEEDEVEDFSAISSSACQTLVDLLMDPETTPQLTKLAVDIQIWYGCKMNQKNIQRIKNISFELTTINIHDVPDEEDQKVFPKHLNSLTLCDYQRNFKKRLFVDLYSIWLEDAHTWTHLKYLALVDLGEQESNFWGQLELVAGQLVGLDFKNTYLPPHFLGFWKTLERLEGLSIVDCRNSGNLTSICRAIPTLTELVYTSSGDTDTVVAAKDLLHLSKLQRLGLRCVIIDLLRYSTNAIFKRLSHLELIGCSFISGDAVKFLATSCNQLVHFHLDMNSDIIDDTEPTQDLMRVLPKLTNLRKVFLDVTHFNLCKVSWKAINACQQLKKLHLTNSLLADLQHLEMRVVQGLEELIIHETSPKMTYNHQRNIICFEDIHPEVEKRLQNIKVFKGTHERKYWLGKPPQQHLDVDQVIWQSCQEHFDASGNGLSFEMLLNRLVCVPGSVIRQRIEHLLHVGELETTPNHNGYLPCPLKGFAKLPRLLLH
jgi:hypothetical protein